VMRHMRLQGNSWQEINKTFVARTEIVPYFSCFHLQQPCIIIYPCKYIPFSCSNSFIHNTSMMTMLLSSTWLDNNLHYVLSPKDLPRYAWNVLITSS
jgi:hypothetical protein